jgi:predicted lactoylglutathione lyase
MESRMNLVTLGVRDLAASKAFYEKLGWKPSSAGNENVVFLPRQQNLWVVLKGTADEIREG